MNIIQAFRLAWKSIVGNKMRSFLTMLGMIIGVASVIILVSLMQGMTNFMVSSFEGFGTNNVSIRLMTRTDDARLDVQDMYDYVEKNNKYILDLIPEVTYQATLKLGSDTMENISITGATETYHINNKRTVEAGKFVQYSDIQNRNKVCVIGSYINKELFSGMAEVGSTMKINGEEFTIVGILKEENGSIEWSNDNCVYVPYTTAARQAGIGTITSYSVQVVDSGHVAQVTSEIEEFLYGVYHDKDLYFVSNMIDILNQVNMQLAMMTTLLTGIAGISLFVAGIGIMNIMLVSVTERTKEIGIRKSLGAKKRDIMRQFVMEAGTTSTIGGAIGIILGSWAAVNLGNAIGFDATPTLPIILVSFGISAGIGIIFGYLPANKAAKLNPIDALRNE